MLQDNAHKLMHFISHSIKTQINENEVRRANKNVRFIQQQLSVCRVETKQSGEVSKSAVK